MKNILNKQDRALLFELVRTDFKLRYQGSSLGYLWSLLKPLFLFGILYIVFVGIVGVEYGVDNSGVYLLLGIVIWSFFSELTGGSVASVVSKGDLIRKLNFPKHIIVLSTALSALINLGLNLLIVAVFVIFSGVNVGWSALLSPLLLAELFLFSLAIGLFLSALYVRLRDVGHVWDVVMQALFYLTPILFPLSFAPAWAQKVLMLNPLAQIIQDLRYVLVSDQTITVDNVYGDNALVRLLPVSIVIIMFFVFSKYFNAKSQRFAEEI